MNIEAIVKKMKGTSDLRSLVRVMKAIAAANIREYNPAQKALLEYTRIIELGLQAILQFGVKEIRMKEEDASEQIGAIIFTANLGLCGQFNHQVIAFFQKKIDEWKLPHEQCSLLVLGEQYKEPVGNGHVESYLSYPSDLDGMSLFLQEVLFKINHWISKDIHRIFLFFNQPDSPTSYSPKVHKLSPIDKEWFDQLQDRKWISRSLPQLTIDTPELFSSYIQEFFFISLYKTVIESYMSENVNRWQSMVMAEKHIDDFMIDLKNEYQQEWQESITEELLDIESAFEVLKKK